MRTTDLLDVELIQSPGGEFITVLALGSLALAALAPGIYFGILCPLQRPVMTDAHRRSRKFAQVAAITLILLLCGAIWFLITQLFAGLHHSEAQDQEITKAKQIIAESLHDQYEFESFNAAHQNSYWVADAVHNDPFTAPEAEVILRDGRIVVWRLLVDPKTGVAQFVNVAGQDSELTPDAIRKDPR